MVLAALLAERDAPPDELWRQRLGSSRLLEYETWIRLDALAARESHGPELAALLRQVEFAELSAEVLARALEPFPRPLRALDALHVSTATYLRGLGEEIRLASYDVRMRAAAAALGLSLYPL